MGNVSRRSFAAWLALLLIGVVSASVIGLAVYSSFQLARFERAEARRTAYVYAAPQVLAPGVNIRLADLAGVLARLHYTETRAAPKVPGQFRRGPTRWEIHVRAGAADGAHALRLDVTGDRIARVERDGQPVETDALEPEVLTSAGERPGEDFRPLRLADAPLSLINAVLAAEDHRFFEHKGVDLRGLLRAAWTNLRAGRVRQGGSTITQQLVKNRLLTPKRTFVRKLDEAWLAALVEWRYSKPQILEAYFNEIYLGQRGPIAVRGLGAAARAYFGREVHQLTLGEQALLAGLARAPNLYSPAANPERARERRNVVLGRMRSLEMISAADHDRAIKETVRVRGPAPGQIAPYFTDLVRQELERRLGEDAIAAAPGTRIFTTLDLGLQRLAEAAVERGLERLEARVPRLRRTEPGERLQAALLVLDPVTGHIRALVGGRSYEHSQFNRATVARRQPGSAFKPFVFLAALKAGSERPLMTAATFVEDTPLNLSVEGRPWSPRNYGEHYEGRVTVRRALEQSLNAATVRVAQATGFPAVVDTARALGLGGDMRPVPALALGAFEVTPIDLARAYATFVNGGVRPPSPSSLRAVRDGDGTPLEFATDAGVPVISPAEAYLITSLLQGVVRVGTAAGLADVAVEVAGKTGTTNDGRDAWFVGYSSKLLAVVWVGFDGSEAHGLSGAQAALPIWADFMRQAHELVPAPAFAVPPGITLADIDTTNGKLATRHCPMVARETFLTGTEPEACTDHGGVTDQITDWWRRLRGWFGR
jgi:penicillin-binding protein 1B